MRKPASAARNGFTLIELLTVVVIIAILVVILLPALGHAQNNARDSQCKSTLHTIGTAINQFATDNSGQMPNPMNYGNSTGSPLATTDINCICYSDLTKYQSGPWVDSRCTRTTVPGTKTAISHYGIPVNPGVLVQTRNTGTVTDAGTTSPIFLHQIPSPSTTAGAACYAPFQNPMLNGVYNDAGPFASMQPDMEPAVATKAPWPMHGDRDQVNIFLLSGEVRNYYWVDVCYNGNHAARQYLWTGCTPGGNLPDGTTDLSTLKP